MCLVAHCKRRRVGKQTLVRGNEAGKQGSDVAWGGAKGVDGQLHNMAEAELSLKNGAWPISKGQSPRALTQYINHERAAALPV